MKHSNSIFIAWETVILAIAVSVAGLPGMGYCQTDNTALLLQQSPPEGGTITPEVGVHHFELNTEVTLVAVPKPGYQFVHWLGNVSNSTASSTVTYIDAPKIIIAVFERAEFEFLPVQERAQSTPVGGLMRGAADYSRQGYSGGGGRRPTKWSWPSWPEPPEPEEEGDFPAPDEGDDFPVPEPIPEPATVALLALGGLFVFARRRVKGQGR